MSPDSGNKLNTSSSCSPVVLDSSVQKITIIFRLSVLAGSLGVTNTLHRPQNSQFVIHELPEKASSQTSSVFGIIWQPRPLPVAQWESQQ